MADFNIKKLTRADVLQAQALFKWFQDDDGDELITAAPDNYIEKMLGRDSFYVIVALHGETIIGGLTAYELEMYKQEITEVFLYEIGVEPEWRKKGVASALINYLKQLCKTKNIEEMYVGAMAGNDAAIQLYKATGGRMEDVAWFVYDLK